jgi:alpha-beta hydrolase superfamily lysophospholipase
MRTSFYKVLVGVLFFALAMLSDAVHAQSSSAAKVVAQEFWTQKGAVRLWAYRKFADDQKPGKPILFLVHGSSYSGKTMFDLQVPGRNDFSLMDQFARLGYDVWTMDHEGY